MNYLAVTDIITQDSLIPISAAVAVIMACVGAAWWIASKLNTLDRRLEKMEQAREEAWTRKDQQIWQLTLALHNPTIRVPTTQEASNAVGS
jgi:arginine exporter protein ArgO